MKKFDLHIHTNASDGICTPEQAVFAAKAAGLYGIAITDHDSIKGLPSAKKAAKEAGIALIPGIEVTTHMGDIIVLGVEEKISGTPSQVFDKAHRLGGIVIVAHPFVGFYQTSLAGMLGIIRDKIDAIEVYNANTSMAANIKAMEAAKRYKITGIASSDSHMADTIGSAFTACNGNDIIKAIKEGKVEIGWL
ncbi:MAG: CehA/McbA family metallohydrolase [Candidatus Aenigmarchaeota archaeon]|nr:CehA/McbA family metallohydrolase [Candidatus Aenigmarchaeota archaeon]